MNIVYVQDDSRVQTLNDRLFSRNVPSHTLQSQFDPRPQSTKYTRMPVFDKYRNEKVAVIQREKEYDQETQFNPGSKAPYSGFATHIDHESQVKNMFMVQQKYSNQSIYIPTSTSDMYNVYVPNDRPEVNTHPLLSKKEVWRPFNPDVYNIGTERYRTHTRQRLKNIPLFMTNVNIPTNSNCEKH